MEIREPENIKDGGTERVKDKNQQGRNKKEKGGKEREIIIMIK